MAVGRKVVVAGLLCVLAVRVRLPSKKNQDRAGQGKKGGSEHTHTHGGNEGVSWLPSDEEARSMEWVGWGGAVKAHTLNRGSG